MKKVLLGMSGGVDSTVSALLLKEMGYEVTGVTMHLFDGGCCDLSSCLDAKILCKQNGMEHVTLQYMDEFRDTIIKDFIDEYKNCLTPNPCILCNKLFKFGLMYDFAKKNGIDYLATGHYAKVEYSEKYNRYVLKKSKNIQKDQTYFLYYIPKDILQYVVFPLGDYENKEEVREIARKNNLSVASKRDSEDICFITNGNYKKFLEENSDIKPKPGNIVLKDGTVVGKHNGLYNYTIGQRKGLGVAYSEPLFVIDFNKDKNEVVVGTKEQIYSDEILVKDYNLLLVDDIKEEMKVNVKTRYSINESSASIVEIEKDGEKYIKVKFDEPVARITPGQSAVFYIDDIVLGGGIICERN